jgi:hypothetical protein
VGRTLSQVAGIVSAGALITFAAAPAALAQTETETTTVPPVTETTSSEATTTAPPISETPTTSVTTTGTTSADPTNVVTTTTTTASASTSTSADSEPPKDNYQDNTGRGFVGPGANAEGVLVIACASGKIGPVSTQYLSVTGGPDQDESDGRYWNYTVRVVDAPAGTTTAKFSWTCDGVEGNGVVEFQQEQPPVTSTSPSTSTSATTSTVSSSTAPITTATSSSAAAAGNSAPKAQVKVAPKGGVETGFGGMAG